MTFLYAISPRPGGFIVSGGLLFLSVGYVMYVCVMYVCNACMYLCIVRYVCMYACMYVMYVCMHVCMHACM